MSPDDTRASHPEREAGGTPRESLLAQLRAANEQLVVSSMHAQDLADQADALRSHAETANRLKDEFLAVVSHELRTPLNAVLAWAHVLGRGQLDPARTASAIQTIERNAKVLARIIDDLLDISRIVGGKIAFDPRPVDLGEVIHAALEQIRLAAEAKGVKVTFTRAVGGGLVGADALRLQQVAVNLLSNAVKYTPPGGKVEVRLTSTPSHAEIRVTDTGQGVAPEFLPHLFERFTQADASTTRRHGGLGLGLSIVKAIVELHGGTVHAESPGAGKGTTVTVRIPLLSPHELEDAGRRHGPDTTAAEPPRLDGVTVLLAEDDPDGRHALRVLLEIAGAKVQAVGSVRGALTAFNDAQPDVLVSDIGMPDEDGYALIRYIRARDVERGGATPAIALTGYVSLADRARILAAGYHVHLRKPVDPSELVATVASLAARAA